MHPRKGFKYKKLRRLYEEDSRVKYSRFNKTQGQSPKKKLAEYLKVFNYTFKILKLKKPTSSTELHHLTYNEIRESSSLPSDIIQEARKDVWAARKKIKKIKSATPRLNKRWFRYNTTKRQTPVFKITYEPRKHFSLPIKKDKGFQRFDSFLKSDWNPKCILLKENQIFVCLEKEFPTPEKNKRNIIGIDVNSKNFVTVSVLDTVTHKVLKQYYFGKDVAVRQRKYEKRRAILKSNTDKGSQKAKKYFKRLKQKQQNFVKNRSGEISKKVIDLAKEYDGEIAIEKLKNLKARKGKLNKKARKKTNRIPYAKLKEFLSSQAQENLIGLYEVDPYHTSQWCIKCGALNSGHHSSNYSMYICKKCGLRINSDRKASLAVACKQFLVREIEGEKSFSMTQTTWNGVPVNALFRQDEVGDPAAVQSENQLTESLSIKAKLLERQRTKVLWTYS